MSHRATAADWARRSVAEDHAGFIDGRPGATVRDLWEHLALAFRQCSEMADGRGSLRPSELSGLPEPLSAEVAVTSACTLRELEASLSEHLSVVADLAAASGWDYVLSDIVAVNEPATACQIPAARLPATGMLT